MYIFYFVSFISQYAQSNTEILTAGQGQLVLDELCTDPCYHFACTAEDLKSAG